MRSPDQFDAFYKDARERLLLQTYALTGDLPAARRGVHDAFVTAWHHWPKASHGDPETWTRPHAWARAHRRHETRPSPPEPDTAPDVRATLDALALLNYDERRIVLLSLLADGPLEDHAREIGVSRDDAARLLQSGTARLVAARGVPSSEVGSALAPLSRVVAQERFPRPTILRRAGSTRRRLHTTAGVIAAAAVLVIGGVVVGNTEGARPALDRIVPGLGGGTTTSEPPAPRLGPDDMLRVADFNATMPTLGWAGTEPDTNTEGDGSALPCQRDRYADPASSTYLVKRFRAETKPGNPKRGAIQTIEASDRDRAAQDAYRTTLLWFASCTENRTQLISTRRIKGVGDQAMLLVLRDWSGPVTWSASVARTGRFTTAVVTSATTDASPDIRANVALLGRAVSGLCQLPEAGACTEKRPEVRTVSPVQAAVAPAMLAEVDLPPVGTVRSPWVGTQPRRVQQNFAATRCDEATFRGGGWSENTTRTFVIPGARLPASFGLTQSVGRLEPQRARGLVADVRRKMASCPERDPGTEVRLILNRSKGPIDLSVWQVSVEVGDDDTVRYLMALARNGGALSQIGFVGATGAQMSDAAFVALAERSLARLGALPGS